MREVLVIVIPEGGFILVSEGGGLGVCVCVCVCACMRVCVYNPLRPPPPSSVFTNYFPEYESSVTSIHSSADWLISEVSRASSSNKTVILFTHSAQGISKSLDLALKEAGGVKLTFAGHLHRCLGRKCMFPTGSKFSTGDKGRLCEKGFRRHFGGTGKGEYSGGASFYLRDEEEEPLHEDEKNWKCRVGKVKGTVGGGQIVWTGSASFQSFVLAEFGEERIRVRARTSLGGKPNEVEVGGKVYPWHDRDDLEFDVEL